MNSAALTDSSLLKNLTVSIDENDILIEDVLSAEIFWTNSLKVSGSIIVNDNVDWGNLLPLNGTNKLVFYAADVYDEYYFKTFIITKVTEVKYKGKFKSFEFEFLDVLSYAMMNTYISKSYTDATISDILEDFWTENSWDDLLDIECVKTFDATTEVKDFKVVPQDRSFYDYIMYELKREGYLLYQTRKEVLLKNKDDLLPAKLETLEFDYTELHPRAEYGFKIHETKNIYNDVYTSNSKAPIIESFYYDFDTKSCPVYVVGLGDVYDDIKINDLDVQELQTTNGIRYGTQGYSLGNSLTNFVRDTYMKNNILEIVVPGNNKFNKIFQNCNIILSGNIAHVIGVSQGDIHSSGIFTCVKITDRIISGKMIQKLELIKVDFQENK